MIEVSVEIVQQCQVFCSVFKKNNPPLQQNELCYFNYLLLNFDDDDHFDVRINMKLSWLTPSVPALYS